MQNMYSFEKLCSLAESGDAEAQYQLGLMYRRGTADVRKSYADSFEWLSKAAKQGHAKANYRLGLLYLYGDKCQSLNITVCPKDEEEAMRCFNKARDVFEKNVQEGLFWLAAMYGKGMGVEVDEKKSAELIRLAADFGNAEAKEMLSSNLRIKLKESGDADLRIMRAILGDEI